MPPEVRILVVTPLVWNLAEGAGMPSPYRTVSGFRDAGFDVDIVIPSSAGRTESDYHGMRVHTFGVPTFGLTGSFGLFRSALLLSGRGGRGDSLRWKAFLAAVLLGGVRRGLEVARSRRPAVVYGMMPVGALAAGAIGRRFGVPKVTRLFGATIAGVSRREYLRNLWEVAALKTPADLFVLVDDGSFADVVAQRLGVPPDRLQHLMNGVEPEYFADVDPADRERVRGELAIEPSTAVFLLAHQFLPWHNQRAFIEAMAAVIARGADVVGLLAGDGAERPQLERLAAELGGGDRIRFLGDVSRARIHDLMTVTTAVVSLDDYSNVVNSVLEGLAMGLPIVATDTGATTTLIEDGHSGLIVEATSVPQLTEALERVATDPQLVEHLRAGARETAARRLVTWDERMRREAELVRALARRGSS